MNWIKQKTWRIVSVAFVFLIAVTLFLNYALNLQEWKDAIQTSAQITVILSIAFAWRQIKITSEQVQSAREQLEAAKDLHKVQFEDSLAREYRELTQKISIKALLGERLTDKEFEKDRQFLFHYLTLTNDQIFLRSKERINSDTWNDWKYGIKSNMDLPAFKKMWDEVENAENKKDALRKSFQELRRLKGGEYKVDPKDWNSVNNSVEPNYKLK